MSKPTPGDTGAIKGEDLLATLRTTKTPATVSFGDCAFQIAESSSMGAEILEFTLRRWPDRKIGEIREALDAAMWWQWFIVNQVDTPDQSPT